MLTPEGLLLALLIFGLRVFNYAISTIRMVLIARGGRIGGAALAFVEALIFAVVIAQVVTDLDNLSNLMAYCLGAAVGSYLGMVLEAHFISAYMTVTIIAQGQGRELAALLRDKGYGITETMGEGRDGPVYMLRSVIDKRDTHHLLKVVRDFAPTAFVAIEEARAIQRGWMRTPQQRRQFG